MVFPRDSRVSDKKSGVNYTGLILSAFQLVITPPFLLVSGLNLIKNHEGLFLDPTLNLLRNDA